MPKLDELHQYSEEDITIDDPTSIVYLRVADAINLLMENNPKIHSINTIANSILRYGFQSPSKYDDTLGAIKDGNGRLWVLWMLENDGRFPVPKGIGVLEDGSWVVPVEVGVDAESVQEALAYSVDANTINLMGSGMSSIDAAMMFDPAMYASLIEELATAGHTPVSIEEEDLDLLLKVLNQMTEKWEEGVPDFSNLTRCPACGHYWEDEDADGADDHVHPDPGAYVDTEHPAENDKNIISREPGGSPGLRPKTLPLKL